MPKPLTEPILSRASSDAQLQRIGRTAPVTARNFALGEQVRGQVAKELAGGYFQVLIEGNLHALNLPSGTRAGDVVKLVVSALEPRLNFTPAGTEQPAGTNARFSDAARFITALLNLGEDAIASPGATSNAPICEAPQNVRILAADLEHAFTQSGMFYEHHQARWVEGLLPLTTLLQEPQAALPPLLAQDDSAPQLPTASPVHADALAIVRQQLDSLNTHSVAWNGFIWPGQVLDWEISEQSGKFRAAPEEQQWQTRLRLNLPRLGEVHATLVLTPCGLAVAIAADARDASGELADALPGLRQALASAGITTLGITVRDDETH